MNGVWAISIACGDVLDQWVGLEVLVVSHVGPGGHVEQLGVRLDLDLVGEDEVHEVDGILETLTAFGDHHDVAPAKDDESPVLRPGITVIPKFMSGF